MSLYVGDLPEGLCNSEILNIFTAPSLNAPPERDSLDFTVGNILTMDKYLVQPHFINSKLSL